MRPEKSGKKTLEIDGKIKICKKVFDHTYIYDATTGEIVCAEEYSKILVIKNLRKKLIFFDFFYQNLSNGRSSHV